MKSLPKEQLSNNVETKLSTESIVSSSTSSGLTIRYLHVFCSRRSLILGIVWVAEQSQSSHEYGSRFESQACTLIKIHYERYLVSIRRVSFPSKTELPSCYIWLWFPAPSSCMYRLLMYICLYAHAWVRLSAFGLFPLNCVSIVCSLTARR